jgi:hypothetical protein
MQEASHRGDMVERHDARAAEFPYERIRKPIEEGHVPLSVRTRPRDCHVMIGAYLRRCTSWTGSRLGCDLGGFLRAFDVPRMTGDSSSMWRRFSMSSLARLIRFTLGAGLVLAGFGTSAWAGPQFTPEIDPGSLAGAATLLSLGALMLTDRRRNK